MKLFILCVSTCVLLALLVAGCTTPTPPVTPTATPTPTETFTPVPTTAAAPVIDPALLGTWTLQQMYVQGSGDPITAFNVPITATFDNQSNLYGNGGCNNYNGAYTLSGGTNEFGKDIRIGPLISTLMYCESTSSTESMYLGIMNSATSYAVPNPQTLSIRDPSGNTLVFTM
ncbi:heat shock protein HslJ [Methanolinea mesophila]|uniref:META domain-containing protein n=1 Tax=Methanolinea mesophila TaxID=547055 RepID=UPI001AEAD94D|nr:META domain-containing protein [Methanolinea mesophila]MBP1929309.1 heat shock protein HslJ [Methanolinea mesophila]